MRIKLLTLVYVPSAFNCSCSIHLDRPERGSSGRGAALSTMVEQQHGYHWYNDRWYSAEEWQGMRDNVQGNEGQHSSEWYQRHNYHWANDHWCSEGAERSTGGTIATIMTTTRTLIKR